MSTLSIRLPDEVEHQLNEEAARSQRNRSELVREAIAEYVARRERERFMTAMVSEARQAYGDPNLRHEAQEMAEEAIEPGNEALDIAEGRKPGEPWPEELGEKWWR